MQSGVHKQSRQSRIAETRAGGWYRLSFTSKLSLSLLLALFVSNSLFNHKWLFESSNKTMVRNQILKDDQKLQFDDKAADSTAVDNKAAASTAESITNEAQEQEQEKDSEEPDGDFTRYDGVVITTKVLWPKDIQHVKEWTCLINHAYNDRVKYDFLVFTTLPWSEEEIAEAQRAAHPAKLTVSLEGPPLEEQIAAMTQEEKSFLFERCNVENNTNITWFHHCRDGKNIANLGYSWQSEFRAYHIWTHPALQNYTYMIWLDTDAYPTIPWKKDPMKIFIDNDLTILYAGWPYGDIKTDSFHQKMMAAYNANLCKVEKDSQDGGFFIYGKMCPENTIGRVSQIAGNHHITNLDVFRKDIHQQFLKNFTGDYRFNRDADDQLAVTIVPIMEQYLINNRVDGIPQKQIVWHETSNNISLRVAHHGMYDSGHAQRGAPRKKGGFYDKFKDSWEGLEDRCAAIFKNKN